MKGAGNSLWIVRNFCLFIRDLPNKSLFLVRSIISRDSFLCCASSAAPSFCEDDGCRDFDGGRCR